MTPEELAIISQLISGGKTLGDFQQKSAAPDVTAPYNAQANKYNTQADALDQQANTPYPQPQGVKENIISGLKSGMQDFGRLGVPGGSTGQEALRRKQFDDENATRIERVKALRGEAAQQQQLGQQKEFQTGELANQVGNLKVAQQNSDRLQQTADNPVGNDIPQGGTRVFTDPHTGIEKPGTRIEGQDKPATGYNLETKVIDEGGGKYGYHAFDMRNGGKDMGRLGDAPPPSSTNGGAGGLLSPAQATVNGQPVIGGYDRKSNTFSPATMKGDNTGAPVQNATAGNAGARAGVAATVDVATADKMLSVMQDTYNRLQSGQSKAPGADDMVLLSNHIAMTFGGVKGARTGRDMIEAHLKARSLPDSLATAAERVLSGGQLTPGQREEFLNLAKSNVSAMHQKQMDLQDSFGGTPAAPAAGGGFVKPGGALESLLKGGK